MSAGEALLAPHVSYLGPVRPLLAHARIKGMAHITGGGITENLPRILPEGCTAEINTAAWQPLPIFRVLQARGRIADDEMFRAFNMGIGLILACAPADAEDAMTALERGGTMRAARIGTVVKGDRTVRYL
jgi:phosphoribosylformylglycinamidine cyclo-ligase